MIHALFVLTLLAWAAWLAARCHPGWDGGRAMKFGTNQNCSHDIADIAQQADGLCPLCLRDEVVRLQTTIDQLKAADRDHLSAKSGMEKRLTAEIELLRSQVEIARGTLSRAQAYVDRAIVSYVGDPPDNQFQRGHLAALEMVRDEAFTPVSSTQCEVGK